jgi:hypothetical protein
MTPSLSPRVPSAGVYTDYILRRMDVVVYSNTSTTPCTPVYSDVVDVIRNARAVDSSGSVAACSRLASSEKMLATDTPCAAAPCGSARRSGRES